MKARTASQLDLPAHGTVAVVGGGPAGAFFALHLLREARQRGRHVRVVIFEPRWRGEGDHGTWGGCNHCAGGLSPRLLDELRELGLRLPGRLIQSRIRSVTIQGYWKNIELEAPAGRELVSVYRGALPSRRADPHQSFDAFLLRSAIKAGAEVRGTPARQIRWSTDGRPVVEFVEGEGRGRLEADFLAMACGVNSGPASRSCLPVGVHEQTSPLLQQALPHYRAPAVRRALIFELELGDDMPGSLEGGLHFVEYGSSELQLEMCSIMPKRGFVTIVLVGRTVDVAHTGADRRQILEAFLALPHIRKLLPYQSTASAACLCSPAMVTGAARRFTADRVAVVGDLASTRLYKDGILSAHDMARALATSILDRGIDAASLDMDYEATIRRVRQDNRFAAIVFLWHRLVFSSSVLSRVLYQAVIYERKTRPVGQRALERTLWCVASGDDQYRTIFRSMLRPSTQWHILTGGVFITLRNYLTELFFGLRWEGIGRFTTGVARERLEAKHAEFARWRAPSGAVRPQQLEFERMYTIKIAASRERVFLQLGQFGEAHRAFLNPRWVRVQRVAGRPNQEGCVIQYEVFHHRFSFQLKLERVLGQHLLVYRVMNGFAKGGVLVFECEMRDAKTCLLSIYLAFRFPRGKTMLARTFWAAFRTLFPAFVHDVIWNHALCRLKDAAEEPIYQSPHTSPRSRTDAAAAIDSAPAHEAV